ncbi:helix-turn-helix transcriptional regulator [Paraburkholderia acidiphila]
MGISLILGISLNTVATHRKRAYAKLCLSSRTELFNVCLKYCV